jgi:hypothetical protein
VNARFLEPVLCLAVPKLPEGPEWQLELKLDGYRGVGIKSNGRPHLTSRNGKNFSERFPTIIASPESSSRRIGYRRRDCGFQQSARQHYAQPGAWPGNRNEAYTRNH